MQLYRNPAAAVAPDGEFSGWSQGPPTQPPKVMQSEVAQGHSSCVSLLFLAPPLLVYYFVALRHPRLVPRLPHLRYCSRDPSLLVDRRQGPQFTTISWRGASACACVRRGLVFYVVIPPPRVIEHAIKHYLFGSEISSRCRE